MIAKHMKSLKPRKKLMTLEMSLLADDTREDYTNIAETLMKSGLFSRLLLALLVVLITSVWIYFGWQTWMFAASLLTIAIIFIAHPLMPRQPEPNRRIKLIGSRFSPLEASDVVPVEGVESGGS